LQDEIEAKMAKNAARAYRPLPMPHRHDLMKSCTQTAP